MTTAGELATVESTPGGGVVIRLRGAWELAGELPSAESVLAGVPAGAGHVTIDGAAIESWDSALLTFVDQVLRRSQDRGCSAQSTNLPAGAERLLQLASAVPEAEGARRGEAAQGPLARLGQRTLDVLRDGRATVTFVGEATLALTRFVRGRARFRWRDLAVAVQEAGAEALGIVSLISFLVGLILAFVGAVQLRLFGAEIYIANLVVIGMAREMAPMMTGVVMAGRTGAAYAAQLGTMTVNEEIDALRTFGFAPMDFLVLPRMLALMLMMPLLSVYSNVLGFLGGAAVGVGMMDISMGRYMTQTLEAARVDDFLVGGIKAIVIGALVAVAGCMRGMQSGRSASAVGLAATSAVVTGIVWIVVSDAVFSVVFDVVGM